MAGHRSVAENRRARFDVAVEETLEAGVVLTSDEIKSIRAERIQLTGAYIKLMSGGKASDELPTPVVVGMHLSAATDPERTRPLLLHGKEVRYLQEELSTKGKTAVPLSVYFKRGWAKVLIGIGKGRKQHDKRQVLRERDLAREQQHQLKHGTR
jgi:SsrA-binding protein